MVIDYTDDAFASHFSQAFGLTGMVSGHSGEVQVIVHKQSPEVQEGVFKQKVDVWRLEFPEADTPEITVGDEVTVGSTVYLVDNPIEDDAGWQVVAATRIS